MIEGPILSNKETADRHVPVMLNRCLDLLAPAISLPGAVAIDCTLGMGGHTEAMLERFPELTVIGLDRDLTAHQLAGKRLRRTFHSCPCGLQRNSPCSSRE